MIPHSMIHIRMRTSINWSFPPKGITSADNWGSRSIPKCRNHADERGNDGLILCCSTKERCQRKGNRKNQSRPYIRHHTISSGNVIESITSAIVQSLYTQCDKERSEYSLLDLLINHWMDGKANSPVDNEISAWSRLVTKCWLQGGIYATCGKMVPHCFQSGKVPSVPDNKF